jgi:hypothetical protein
MVFYLASENETRGIDVLKFSKLYALFTREPLAWAVRKNDPELLKSANEFLKFFNEQGKLIPLIKSRIPHAE